jgi:hypothetical protein
MLLVVLAAQGGGRKDGDAAFGECCLVASLFADAAGHHSALQAGGPISRKSCAIPELPRTY